MIRKALMAAAAGSLIATTSAAYAHIVDTRGGGSCAAWLQQRPKQSKLLEAWLLGFVSGMAQGADVHVPKDVDDDAIFLWMDGYCKANPRQGLVMGGLVLSNKLIYDRSLK